MKKTPMPKGYDLEIVGKIKSEAQRSFRQEHIAVFGNFLGPEISRDMVRHVLMTTEGVEGNPPVYRDDVFQGKHDQPQCCFFEQLPGSADPDEDFYCNLLCHMSNREKDAEFCKGDYLKCPHTNEGLFRIYKAAATICGGYPAGIDADPDDREKRWRELYEATVEYQRQFTQIGIYGDDDIPF